MLNKIIRFSIQHKLVVGIGVLALLISGFFALRSLPIDAIPDITNNQVQVFTLSPSLSAPEVERLITMPIEQQLVSVPGRTEIRSISRFGLSVVTVVFEEDIDVYWARQQVTERLKMAEELIPPGVGTPELGPISTGLSEIYQYTVHPQPGFEDKYDAMELRTIQDWYVRRQLLGTRGVADVSSLGGYLKQYEVSITPQRLVSMNVTIDELFSALEQNNQNAGGAYIERNENAYFIRSEGMVSSLDDIRKIPLKQNANGTPMFLGDVADVRFGHAVRYGALTRNGEGEAVGGIVLMLKGANSSEVADRVKARLEEIKKTLPEGVTVSAFLDRTKLVDTAIGTVAKNLVEGALIVIFVLVLLLGNLRAGLIVASVIPLAMLFAVCMMRLFGVSGNLMSLGAIDFGLIVDGAVIIVEATLHHMSVYRMGQQLTKEQMNEEVYESASKIRNAAAFGEIIILIVYLPILALTGIEGKMFRPMAETVVFAILGAFLLSLTYVPMMSALFLNRNIKQHVTFSDRMISKFQQWYQPVIRWALRHPVKISLSAFSAFGVCVVLFMNMGGEFIPQLDEGDFAVETRAMQGGSLSYSVDIASKAEKLLLQHFPDEVEQVVGKIGAPEIPTDPMPVEANDMMVILKDRKYWKKADTREELADTMSKTLSAIIGVNFGFQQPIQMRFNELMTGARQDVVVKIYGDDLDVLTEYANKMGAIVTSVQGAKDIYIEKVTGLPQIVVKLRRDNIARYGLTVQEINHVVNTAFAGQKAGVVFEGEKRFDLVVRLDSTYRKQISDVSTLNIAAGNRQIPLSEVADVSFINGPAQVQREDARRRIMVGFNVRGRDVESIVEELKQKTNAQIKLPPGYSLSYEGQFKNLEEAKSRLAIAVPAALLLIMMLLYFTFRSLKQTLLIFTAIPLAAIGGVLFLLLRGMPFSISAGVGFIALFGVAVLNGIVLIAEFNKLKKEGMEDVFQRIETGVMVRLRPVLMTAAVASLGFLPMAISQSGGAEVQRPLATVVIGGLITSTILTLVVLPALYLLIERRTKVKPALVAVLLLGLAFPAHAQQVYTIDEAAAKMLNTHPQAKAAAADVEEAAALKPAAWDMGKTSLGVQVGQFNSRAVDNGLSVSQSIPFPTQMVAQHKVYASVEQEKMLQQQLTKQDLLYQLRQCYIALQYEYAYRQRVQELDSVYSVLQYAADWRYKSGESTRLEQVNLLTRKQDMVLQLTQSGQEIMGLRKNLQWLLGDSALPNITPALPESDGVTLSENHIADHPSMKLYEQKIQTALLEQKKAGQALWPDLTVGLTNQTLVGYQNVDGTEQYYSKADRFTAVQLGVAVPLIWGPQNARIKAARKQVTAAGARADAWERQLTATYDKTQQETESALTALRYYESQALPNAELISSKAYAAFKAGDIGYLELLQSLDTAYNIYRQYLAAQRDLRLKQLSLLYLNGSL